MDTPTSLKRGIRFRDLVLFYIVSGLNVRWTAMAASAGPSILVVWIAALLCFFVPLAASVSELSSRYPGEGGLYLWTREAFGEFPGFLAAWTYWMSNLPFFPGVLYFGAASVLFAFGPEAQGMAKSPGYFMTFAAGWLVIITLVNIRGVDLGKWLNNVSSLGSLAPLSVLVVLALLSWLRNGSATHFNLAALTPHLSFQNALFWSSVFFAFGGVEAGSSMGDEIENPRRIIPWAILLGGSVMTAFLSSTSRLPFVAGIHNCLPPVFSRIHPRYRTPWVAIGVYGLAGILVALLGQAGTTVRGAYEVLVSMAILTYFLPYLYLFAAMIRLQSQPAGPEVRRVPGGKPVAWLLGAVGILSTSATILLSVIPADDEPNKPLAVVKVVGGTAAMVGLGLAVFLVSRRKAKRDASSS